MDDFWDEPEDNLGMPTDSPKHGPDDSPQDLEWATAILTCTVLLRHSEPGERDDGSKRSAALASIVPHFWLTLARTTATLTQPSGSALRSEPVDCRLVLEETERWLTRALQSGSFDAHVLHTAAMTLYELLELEGLDLDRRGKLIERACELLGEADRLAPGRFDILSDLGTLLGMKAERATGDERNALALEALDRFDRAADCFPPTQRRFIETGSLHPDYRRALSSAGVLRCSIAIESSGTNQERVELFRRGDQQILESEVDTPVIRSIQGRAALVLAELPGEPDARYKLFEEACRHFEKATEGDPAQVAEAYAQWADATVGCAILATDAKRQNLIRRAEELFTKAARKAAGASGPDKIASRAWLLLARESSAKEEQQAARRAADAAQRANRKEPGSGDYNLACALSRLRQPDEAAKALTAALARDPETASSVLSDPDLQLLWEAKPDLRQTIAAGSD